MSTQQHRTIYLVPARVGAARPVAARPVVPLTRVAAPLAPQPTIRRVQHHVHSVAQSSGVNTLKRPIAVASPLIEDDDPLEALLNDGSGQGPPRKRERLNHLSSEEKMNRRKLKNRVAAQTARDRKKARSQRMEEVVRQLMEENQRLREENSRLRADQSQKGAAIESAAFISGPLPRVQVASLLPLFLLLTTSFRKTHSTVSSKNSRRISTSINSPVSCRSSSRSLKRRSSWRMPLTRLPRKWDVP